MSWLCKYCVSRLGVILYGIDVNFFSFLDVSCVIVKGWRRLFPDLGGGLQKNTQEYFGMWQKFFRWVLKLFTWFFMQKKAENPYFTNQKFFTPLTSFLPHFSNIEVQVSAVSNTHVNDHIFWNQPTVGVGAGTLNGVGYSTIGSWRLGKIHKCIWAMWPI